MPTAVAPSSAPLTRQVTPTSTSSDTDHVDILVTPRHNHSAKPHHGYRTLTGPDTTASTFETISGSFTSALSSETGSDQYEPASSKASASIRGSPQPRKASSSRKVTVDLSSVGPFFHPGEDASTRESGGLRGIDVPWPLDPVVDCAEKGLNNGQPDVHSFAPWLLPSPFQYNGIHLPLQNGAPPSSPRNKSHGQIDKIFRDEPIPVSSNGVHSLNLGTGADVPLSRNGSVWVAPQASTPPPNLAVANNVFTPRLSTPESPITVNTIAANFPCRSRSSLSSWSTDARSVSDSCPPTARSSDEEPSYDDVRKHNAQLRAQLRACGEENAVLAKRCEDLIREVGILHLSLHRVNRKTTMIAAATRQTTVLGKAIATPPTTPNTVRESAGSYPMNHGPSDPWQHSPSMKYLGAELYETVNTHVPTYYTASHGHHESSALFDFEPLTPHPEGGSALPQRSMPNGITHPGLDAQSSWHASSPRISALAATRANMSLPNDLASYPHGRPYTTMPQGPLLRRGASMSPLATHCAVPIAGASLGYHKEADCIAATPEALVARALTGRSQESSILLQQQLKSGPSEVKSNVLSAIRPQLVALSEDKHCNFLVQRAIGVDFDISWELRHSFERLALSQYGCHVVQRVLDGGEDIKRQIVEELLTGHLLDTLTSRNAVHVWAKVLEIEWTDKTFRTKVLEFINKQVRGRWATIAMQETGSIVVQNLFESAGEGENVQCVDEILDRLVDCAANQWGVWVVQHIVEHGSKRRQAMAFEKLLSGACQLSLSSFGQKAIMTALKTKDNHFVKNYLDLLCEGADTASLASSAGRRSMLVDVASTPQGLQIMTQLLTTVGRGEREKIIKAVRKNSVFLKGSKTGLKIYQMCERARAYSGY